MVRYVEPVFRPPSEAGSLIIQATLGCSHNKCSFCGSYLTKPFKIRSLDEIREDLEDAARTMGPVRKVFLADGDALAIPQKRLVEVLKLVGEHLPSVERIGIYANARDVLRKSVEELRLLRSLKLGIIYLGVETGDPELLKTIRKGAGPEEMIAAARRVKEAGIPLSVTILLGIGGVEGGERHAKATAELLTAMDPEYVGALSVIIVPGTELHERYEKGEFQLPDPFGLIHELKIMIRDSSFSNCVFRSNHASNYLPVKATLPDDKQEILTAIDNVLQAKDSKTLRPEFLRAL